MRLARRLQSQIGPLMGAGTQQTAVGACSVLLVNVIKEDLISVATIEAKLGSARLLADIEAADNLAKMKQHKEVILKLGPVCFARRLDGLERPSQIRALALLKVLTTPRPPGRRVGTRLDF